MRPKIDTQLLVGTQQGIYRVRDDSVVPLSTELESVPILLCAAGGSWFAGTGHGRLFRTEPHRVGWAECSRESSPRSGASDDALEAIARVPGSSPRLLAAMADGQVFVVDEDRPRLRPHVDLANITGVEVDEPAASTAYYRRRISARLDPSRPRAVLVASAAHGLFRIDVDEPDRAELLLPARDFHPHGLAVQPEEADLWLVAGTRELRRTTDGGRTFQPVTLGEPSTGIRAIAVEPCPGGRFVVLCDPRPPDPKRDDPSPLWISSDGGQSFVVIDADPIDQPRDPCGELLCIALLARGEERALLYGTDRGELLRLRRGRKVAELLATDLPAVLHIEPLVEPDPVDPSTSGIHLLP